MINSTKYQKILKVIEDFPFLKGAVKQNGITSIFEFNDLIDPQILNIYTDDIYELFLYDKQYSYIRYSYYENSIKKLLKHNSDNKNFKLMQIYNNVLECSDITYKYFKISEDEFNEGIKDDLKNFLLKIIDLYNNFSFTKNAKENFKTNTYEYYDKEDIMYFILLFYKMILMPFLNNLLTRENNYSNKKNRYSFKLLFQLLNKDELYEINKMFSDLNYICIKVNLLDRDDEKFQNIIYLKNEIGLSDAYSYYSTQIKNELNKEIDAIYNNFSISEIKDFCNDTCENLSELFAFFNIKYIREISLLNSELSIDEQNTLLEKFKTADSIKKIIANIFKNRSITFAQLDFIFQTCILDNTKIKDRNFPKDKTKVICNTIRNIFISNNNSSTSIYKLLSTDDLLKLIKKYKKYFYNVYFIQSIIDSPSLMESRSIASVDNSKELIKILFENKSLENEIKEFIINYIKVIQNKPNNDDNPCKDRSNLNIFHITYGFLTYLMVKYINFYEKTDELFSQFIYQNIILNDNIKVDKFPLMLLYVMILKYDDFLNEAVAPFNSSSFNQIEHNELYYSPFAIFLEDACYETSNILKVKNHYSDDYNCISKYTQFGSINMLLSVLNYNDTFNLEYLNNNIFEISNPQLTNYYYYNFTIQSSDKDFAFKKNSEVFILLKCLDNIHDILEKDNRLDIFENTIKNLKKIIDNDSNVKNIVLTPSSNIGNMHIRDSENRLYKFKYDNSIDFEALFQYFELINLNKKYNLFNIDSSFLNCIFVPQLGSRKYSYEKDSINGNVYSRMMSSKLISKYSEKSVLEDIYQKILKLTDSEKKFIYDKFFKPYINDDFNYNEYFNNTLVNEIENLYKEDSENYGQHNKNLFKYIMLSKHDDEDSNLINGSIMETFVQSYFDLFDILDFSKIAGEEELEKLKNKLLQSSINYECMRSIIN